MANGNRELRRINPGTNRIDARVRLPDAGLGAPIAVGEVGVWVTGAGAHLYRLDPQSMELARVPLPRGASPGPVTIGFGSVWVIDLNPVHDATYGTLYRIDQRSGRVISAIRHAGWGQGGLIAAAGSIWTMADGIKRIDPTAGTRHRVAGPGCGQSAAGNRDFVWFADCVTLDSERRFARLVRVSVRSNTATVIRRGPGQYIKSVAVGFGSVWVLRGKPMLERLDPETTRVLGRMALPAPDIDSPGIAIGFGSIYIRARDRVLRLEPKLSP